MRKKKENAWMQEIIEKYDRRYRKPKWKRWNKNAAPPPNLYPSVKRMYRQVHESLDEQ